MCHSNWRVLLFFVLFLFLTSQLYSMTLRWIGTCYNVRFSQPSVAVQQYCAILSSKRTSLCACYRYIQQKNWSWGIKFSRRSYGDSNPRHFDHESGALTTELSQLLQDIKTARIMDLYIHPWPDIYSAPLAQLSPSLTYFTVWSWIAQW